MTHDFNEKAAEMFETEKYGKVTSQRVINEFSIVIQPKFKQDRRRSRGEEGNAGFYGKRKNSRKT